MLHRKAGKENLGYWKVYASVRKTNLKTTILVAPGEYFGLQVTGRIEGFSGGLIFDSADVWVRKFGKYFLGGLI